MSIRVHDSKHLSGHPRMAKMVKDNNLIHNLNLLHLQRKAGVVIYWLFKGIHHLLLWICRRLLSTGMRMFLRSKLYFHWHQAQHWHWYQQVNFSSLHLLSPWARYINSGFDKSCSFMHIKCRILSERFDAKQEVTEDNEEVINILISQPFSKTHIKTNCFSMRCCWGIDILIRQFWSFGFNCCAMIINDIKCSIHHGSRHQQKWSPQY